ncbi:hypothetical protein AQJ43_31565 [Streptomyces avermitilis]|nr:hypothetical protein AQJ43_31565 [Streptomyces avermitilis]
MVRHLTRATVTSCCAAALALTQTVQAHAASRTVNFNYQHIWKTPEFETGIRGRIHFTVKKCDHPNGDMTVLLRRTDGFNYVVGSRNIKCRAGHTANWDDDPAGTYEFELGKLDDYKFFKGTATYSFNAAR